MLLIDYVIQICLKPKIKKSVNGFANLLLLLDAMRNQIKFAVHDNQDAGKGL